MRTETRLLVLVALLAVFAPALAAPDATPSRVSGTLVIGTAEYDGGVVQVTAPKAGNLAEVRIDGILVARVFRHALDLPQGSRPELVFSRDASGRQHLVGIRAAVGGVTSVRPFTVAMQALPRTTMAAAR